MTDTRSGANHRIDQSAYMTDTFIQSLIKSAGDLIDENRRESLAREIKEEVRVINLQIPPSPDEDDSLMRNLRSSVHCFAFAKVTARMGWPVEKSGPVIFRACRSLFCDDPLISADFREKGKIKFCEGYREKMKLRAEESKKRERSLDFVFDFVEGDGAEFDYGVNYIRCGIMELAKKLDMMDLMHYLCLVDYPIYRAFGIGLTRTGTLAQGKPFCDFRFVKDGKIELETPEPE